MSKRFRFISGTYLVVAAIVPLPLYVIASLTASELPWLTASLIAAPVAIAVAMTRRGYVSVQLDGAIVHVRRGLWPAQILSLPESRQAGEDPFRAGQAGGVPSIQFETADHAQFETRSSAGRVLARFTTIVRAALRVLGTGSTIKLGDPMTVDVSMTQVAFRDARGELQRILLPRKGEANERELEALREALEAAGQRALES